MDCAQTKRRGRGASAMVDDREEWEMCEEGEEGRGAGQKIMRRSYRGDLSAFLG